MLEEADWALGALGELSYIPIWTLRLARGSMSYWRKDILDPGSRAASIFEGLASSSEVPLLFPRLKADVRECAPQGFLDLPQGKKRVPREKAWLAWVRSEIQLGSLWALQGALR